MKGENVDSVGVAGLAGVNELIEYGLGERGPEGADAVLECPCEVGVWLPSAVLPFASNCATILRTPLVGVKGRGPTGSVEALMWMEGRAGPLEVVPRLMPSLVLIVEYCVTGRLAGSA